MTTAVPAAAIGTTAVPTEATAPTVGETTAIPEALTATIAAPMGEAMITTSLHPTRNDMENGIATPPIAAAMTLTATTAPTTLVIRDRVIRDRVIRDRATVINRDIAPLAQVAPICIKITGMMMTIGFKLSSEF